MIKHYDELWLLFFVLGTPGSSEEAPPPPDCFSDFFDFRFCVAQIYAFYLFLAYLRTFLSILDFP